MIPANVGPDDAALRATLADKGIPPERVDEVIAAYRAEQTNGSGTNGAGASASVGVPLTDEQRDAIAAYRQWLMTTLHAVPPDVLEIDYVTGGVVHMCDSSKGAPGNAGVGYTLYVTPGRAAGEAAWMYRGYAFHQLDQRTTPLEHWDGRPASPPPDEVLVLRDEYDRKRSEAVAAEYAARAAQRAAAGPAARPARSADAGAPAPLRVDSHGVPTFALLDDACEYLSVATPDSVTKTGRWEWYRSSSGNYGVCVNADGSGAVRTFDPEDRAYFDAVDAPTTAPQPAQNEATAHAAPPVGAMLPAAASTSPTGFGADAFGPGSSDAALRVSEAFMHERLRLSGVTPADYPIPPTPLPTSPASFRIDYPGGVPGQNFTVRHDRAHSKYTSATGVAVRPYWATPPGAFATARTKVIVEGETKAVAAAKRLALPVVGLRGNWGWSAGGDVDKQMHAELLETLNPGDVVVVLFDGDATDNEDVGQALATLCMMLRDQCAVGRIITPDLGHHPTTGDRLGFDDFALLYPTDDAIALQHRVAALPQVKLKNINAARTWTLADEERYKLEHVDLTPMGAGNLLVRLHGARNLRFMPADKSWAVWVERAKRWYPVPGDQATGSLTTVVSRFYKLRADVLYSKSRKLDEQTQIAGQTPEAVKAMAAKADELRTEAKMSAAWGIKCSGGGMTTQMIDHVRGAHKGLHVSRSDFDPNPDVLAVRNGIVDLRTGLLRAEVQEDMILTRSDVRWDAAGPPAAALARVERFLREMTADSYTVTRDASGAIVQRHVVYSPSRYAYLLRHLGSELRGGVRDRRFDLWHGAGADGKSVLASLLLGALGSYAGTLPASAVLGSAKIIDGERARPFLMTLRGKRFVVMAESRDTSHLDEALVKSLTGGDRQSARANYGSPVEFNIEAQFILLTNALPKVTGMEQALWDRLSPMPFHCPHNRAGTGAVDMTRPDADEGLKAWCEHDRSAHFALLWLLVQECVAYRTQGLAAMPGDVRAVAVKYHDSANNIATWVADAGLKIDPQGKMLAKAALGSYAEWCADNRVEPPGRTTFHERLPTALPGVFVKVGTGGMMYVFGLRVPTMAEDAEALNALVMQGIVPLRR